MLMTVGEVSKFLNVHPNTIYKWKAEGRIPFTQINGCIRFERDEIEAWRKTNSFKPHNIPNINIETGLALDGYDKLFLRMTRRSQLNGTTRFSYGIGSVILRKTKRKEERFYVDFQIGKRRVRKAIREARTRAEAVKALNAEVSNALRGKYNFQRGNPEVTFREMADVFLEKYSKPKKKSWKSSDQAYLHALNPFFGEYKLKLISPLMIETYISQRLSDGLKKCSVNREVSCLRKIFNVAMDWGYASQNPVRRVKLFSERENLRERVLLPEEETRLFENCSSHLRGILMTALHAGMRRGEIFALKWADVDFKRREIRVTQSKSGRSRVLPVNSILLRNLESLKAQNGMGEYVFTNPKTGKRYSDIKKAFAGACRRAAIRDLRFHDLRHTFASRLVKKGVDLIIVKELMGHASVITTQRYTHSQAEEKLRAVETLTENPQKSSLECQKNVKSRLFSDGERVLSFAFSNN